MSPEEFDRTRSYAVEEDRSVANFMRMLFLIGLAKYEIDNKKSAMQVTSTSVKS